MKKIFAALIASLALAVSATGLAQDFPGAPDAKRITAGSYKIDPNHTQVFWTVNHMGITPLTGAFAANDGTLVIDPAHPGSAKVNVTFATASITTTAPAFTKHLSSNEFFDVARFPTASFSSTNVRMHGSGATITGDLTIKGTTKPVVLEARLFGAGTNPMSKRLNIGFSATTTVKRSDFGLGYALPVVGDEVEIRIIAAFEPTA